MSIEWMVAVYTYGEQGQKAWKLARATGYEGYTRTLFVEQIGHFDTGVFRDLKYRRKALAGERVETCVCGEHLLIREQLGSGRIRLVRPLNRANVKLFEHSVSRQNIHNPNVFDELERFNSIYNPTETIIIHNYSDRQKIENIIQFVFRLYCEYVFDPWGCLRFYLLSICPGPSRILGFVLFEYIFSISPAFQNGRFCIF